MTDPALMEEEFTGRLTFAPWKRVLRYVLELKRYFIVLLSISAVTAGCDAAIYLAIRGVIDEAVAGRGGGVLRYGLMFVGLVTTQVVCVWVFIVVGARISQNMAHNIRRDIFARLQELPFSYYDRRPVGWLMARATSDCQQLGRLLAWGLLDLSWGFFMMIALAGMMLSLNWRLSLAVFAVVPPLVWISAKFQKLLLHSSRQVRKTNSQITGAYNEGIVAVRTTKTLHRQESNLAEFRQLTLTMYRQSVRNSLQSAMYLPIVQTLGAAGAGVAMWFGGMMALGGQSGGLAGALGLGTLSLGTLVLFINCASRFFDPVNELARVLTDVQAAQASTERVMGLLATEPEIQDSAEVRRSIEVQRGSPRPGCAIDGGTDGIGEVCFRDVSFVYAKGSRVLDHFNLTVRAGETIALVGPTGGGKTTIVSLLCRFYEPTGGEILIDGVDYRKRSLHWLQSNLGVVLQTPHLFSGTIRENIRYGRLDATDEEVVQAARLAHAEQFILSNMTGPAVGAAAANGSADTGRGYDAQVGQGGNRLSMGQKQLIALARAVLANPRLLVMDEATSSVDTETERLIQRGVDFLCGRGEGAPGGATLKRSDRICFVIAHRLSTIRSAGRILVIDQGRIVEEGSHHELILRKGRYFELYSNQFRQEKQDQLLQEDETRPE